MDKLEYTNKIFDEYESRFQDAIKKKPHYKPWEQADRKKIKDLIKEVLGYKEELVPELSVISKKNIRNCEYTVEVVLAQSWKNCYTCANLYKPVKTGKIPLIFVFCGHGNHGRLTESYQAMAQRLVKQGAAVLLVENIGQGERAFMGHVPCTMPFYCGLSLQGMIVMESVAWINEACKWDFVDETKIGVCGNSGGGVLTMFISALCDKISCVASTGYPSSFGWIGSKEKLHCHCNVLPHVLSKLEMFDVYSLIAPRPLIMLQGYNDEYFPSDLFNRNARNVLLTYKKLGAEDKLVCDVVPGMHSWDNNRRFIISKFFAQNFSLDDAVEYDDTNDLFDPNVSYVDFPDISMTTDEVAMSITGIRSDKKLRLYDVFVPLYKGKEIKEDEIIKDFGKGDCMQIFAQFEAFV